jgi:hypothetical protein
MTDPILVAAESSINALPGRTQNRLNEFREGDETKGIDDQRRGRSYRRSTGRRPIGPLSRHGEAAEIGIA